MNSLSLQQQAEKVGMFKSAKLAQVLGNFVFAIIIITALIVAFEAPWYTRRFLSLQQPCCMKSCIAIPNIIAAGLILILAYVVSRFVARLVVDVIASGTGVDNVPAKLDVQRFFGKTKLSDIVGYLIVFFTMLFAVSEAANRLGFEQISGLDCYVYPVWCQVFC